MKGSTVVTHFARINHFVRIHSSPSIYIAEGKSKVDLAFTAMSKAKGFSLQEDGSIATSTVKVSLEEQQPKVNFEVRTVAMSCHLHYCRRELFLCLV